jgi:hypothetical protein
VSVQKPVAPDATVPHTCCPVGHAEMHAPLPQTSLPGQIELHVPLEQTWPAEHTLPQWPQLFGSLSSCAHSLPHCE